MKQCHIGPVSIGGIAPVRLMGVINCSPESFYRGSYTPFLEVHSRAQELVAGGADIIDLGARSTAPGTPNLSPAEEIERMAGALDQLEGSGIVITVDTTRPEVLERCLSYDIAGINDIGGLHDPRLAALAAEAGLPVIAMATWREPGDPKGLEETLAALREVVRRAEDAGITSLILDPAIGRWSSRREMRDDLEICRNFAVFRTLGRPLLAAVSRKTFIGELVGRPPEGRLAGSLAVTFSLLMQGASMVRTHDIPETRDLIAVHAALSGVP
jgi:dihydropteroate synthase